MVFSRIIGAAALVALASGTVAQADAWALFVVNSTGKSIYKIEVAPAATSAWSPAPFNPNNGTRLDSGARREIDFYREADKCRYDLRATFSDLSAAVYSGVNVCDYSYVTLKLVNGKAAFTGD